MDQKSIIRAACILAKKAQKAESLHGIRRYFAMRDLRETISAYRWLAPEDLRAIYDALREYEFPRLSPNMQRVFVRGD